MLVLVVVVVLLLLLELLSAAQCASFPCFVHSKKDDKTLLDYLQLLAALNYRNSSFSSAFSSSLTLMPEKDACHFGYTITITPMDGCGRPLVAD